MGLVCTLPFERLESGVWTRGLEGGFAGTSGYAHPWSRNPDSPSLGQRRSAGAGKADAGCLWRVAPSCWTVPAARAPRSHPASHGAGARGVPPPRRPAPGHLAEPRPFLRCGRPADAPHPGRLRSPPSCRQARRIHVQSVAGRRGGGRAAAARGFGRRGRRPKQACRDGPPSGARGGATGVQRIDGGGDRRGAGRFGRHGEARVDDGPGLVVAGAPRGRTAVTPEEWGRVKDLFLAALARAPGQWDAFLRDACGSDDSLRAEVASLLAAHERGDTFIDSPGPPGSRHEALEGTALGAYELLRVIGRGGMATVYLAHDSRHDRQVALKILRPELAASPGPGG